MSETVDAINEHTIKGLDPLGSSREIGVSLNGRLYVAGGAFETPAQPIPGIGTGAAYATGDAFGGMFTIPVPVEFKLQAITFIDLDNEKIAKDVVFYASPFTATADNAAFAPSAADLQRQSKAISIAIGDYVAFNANALATVTGIEITMVCPSGFLYGQWVTRGADNIAAGSIPLFYLSGEVR